MITLVKAEKRGHSISKVKKSDGEVEVKIGLSVHVWFRENGKTDVKDVWLSEDGIVDFEDEIVEEIKKEIDYDTCLKSIRFSSIFR